MCIKNDPFLEDYALHQKYTQHKFYWQVESLSRVDFFLQFLDLAEILHILDGKRPH